MVLSSSDRRQPRPRVVVLLPLAFGLPNHPSYPSGHSCASAAAGGVLSHFFPERAANLDAQVAEAGESRIIAGIHYRFDVVAGQEIPREVGEDAVAEPPARLVEATERQRPDDAVDGEPALLLEGAHGKLYAVVEEGAQGWLTLERSIAQKTDPLEQTGDLGDCGTGVPVPDDPGVRAHHSRDCSSRARRPGDDAAGQPM